MSRFKGQHSDFPSARRRAHSSLRGLSALAFLSLLPACGDDPNLTGEGGWLGSGGTHHGAHADGDRPLGAPGENGSGGAPSAGDGTGGLGPSDSCSAGALIDDLESPTTHGAWRTFGDGTGTLHPSGAFEPEPSSDGGSLAVHLVGSGFSIWGAGIARTFDPPADCLERSTGVKFRAKGPGTLTFAAPVAAVVPVGEGGNCTAGDQCQNAHETRVQLSAAWKEYTVSWTSLAQAPGWGLDASFDRNQVLELLFSARPDQQPFDFWIDDLRLVDGGAPGGTGGSPNGDGGTGSAGDCALDDVVGKQTWLSWYGARRNSFYTYEALCEALESYPGFATRGSLDDRKREVAGFFANVSRETGELEYVEQIVKSPPTYYGRGPLQLTHDYNYSAAGQALGVDLLGNPGLLASDPVLTWKASLWFWMTQTGAGSVTCHEAMVDGHGFGESIRTINGALECHPGNDAALQRIDYYQSYAADLGVSPGTNLDCW